MVWTAKILPFIKRLIIGLSVSRSLDGCGQTLCFNERILYVERLNETSTNFIKKRWIQWTRSEPGTSQIISRCDNDNHDLRSLNTEV
jgi:hypothetical protein